MEQARLEDKRFRLGEWVVDPRDCTLRSGGDVRHLEPQVMELLWCLASRPGDVVSRQQIFGDVWKGRIVTEDSLTGSVSELRKALGDEARTPRYIETIPKRGYRLLVPPAAATPEPVGQPTRQVSRRAAVGVAAAVVAAAAVVSLLLPRTPNAPRKVPARAVESYLKGRAALDQRTPESVRQSTVYFKEAIDLDPQLAEASAGLSEASMFMIASGLASPSELSSQARSSARKALELDPGLGEAHASSGAVLALIDRQFPQAEAEFRRALQLQPGLPSTHLGYALLLTAQGRHEEAIEHGRQALALDPLSLPAHWSLAEILIVARRYEETVELLRRALQLDPRYANAHFGTAIAFFLLSKEREAWDAFRSGLGSQGIADEAVQRLDAEFSRGGMGAVFKAVATYLEQQPIQTPAARNGVALYYCLAGERDRAFAALEVVRQQQSPLLLWLAASPYADQLRADPRFSALVNGLAAQPASY